jgi:hypothetical protein
VSCRNPQRQTHAQFVVGRLNYFFWLSLYFFPFSFKAGGIVWQLAHDSPVFFAMAGFAVATLDPSPITVMATNSTAAIKAGPIAIVIPMDFGYRIVSPPGGLPPRTKCPHDSNKILKASIENEECSFQPLIDVYSRAGNGYLLL